MTHLEIIELLEKEWEAETGFFGKLRFEGFDPEGFQRVETLLQKVTPECPSFPQRLVALTWFIPLFMSWQEVPEIPDEDYKKYCGRMQNLVMNALGVP